MKKYGWSWKSEASSKMFTEILTIKLLEGGTFADKIEKVIELAEKITEIEGDVPDSFTVLVEFGDIYTTAAVKNVKNTPICNKYITKAKNIQRLASKYVVDNRLNDPESDPDDFASKTYLGHYFQIRCSIEFVKYIQTDCKDVSYLKEIKPYFQEAVRLIPDNAVLQVIGKEIHKKLEADTISSQFQPRPHRQPSVSDKGGCFIATAIYGSYDSAEVLLLRELRDKFLLTNSGGKLFVKIYYSISPTISNFIMEKPKILKAMKNYLFEPAIKYIFKRKGRG